ncbi:unnamed protein product [Heligmosomoides polygyrus]|uniref:BAR domain-containing protein n=1 Tax=Heligmosomoides polygyrus TaxID=6339 RepID=A0A183G3D3_HELPZ|nr:unnamed protein product [Heligmosomoides polygyrus]
MKNAKGWFLRSTASKTFKKNAERSFETLRTNLEETNVILRRVYAQMPRPVTEGPNFSITDKQEVAKIRQLKGNNIRKFALELERKLYQTEPQERNKDLESRVNSADKVQFIKECIFMFCNINGEGPEP